MTASSLRRHCGFIWLIVRVKTAMKLRCFHLTAETFLETGCLGPHYKTSLKKNKKQLVISFRMSPLHLFPQTFDMDVNPQCLAHMPPYSKIKD